jgi:hypothetical protein
MPKERTIKVVGQQREFDERTWKRLLTSLAYLLHERRKQLEDAAASVNGRDDE